MTPLIKHLSVAALVVISLGTIHAELPTIGKEPWKNHFVVFKQKKFQLGIMDDGSVAFHPLNKRGEVISESNPILFKIEILETKSDGKTTSKKIDPASLTSDQAATLNPEKAVTITGTATGDIAFHVTFTPQHDGFDVSGQIVKNDRRINPLNLAIEVGLRPYAKDKTRTLEERKRFDQRTKRDKLVTVISSGKTKTYAFNDDATFATDMPDGTESLSMKAEAYDSTEFHIAAHGGGKIHFTSINQLVYDGVDFQWIMPAEADPKTNFLRFTAK